MPNSSGVCTSFKKELLLGVHAFGVPPARASAVADAFKTALYAPTATINKDTPAYTTAGEFPTAGGYTQGGKDTVWIAPGSDAASGVAFTTPNAPLVWTGVTMNPDCALVYNSTQGGKAVAAYQFAVQSVVTGNFSLTMPPNNKDLGLLRVV